jgi:hypothetical protein
MAKQELSVLAVQMGLSISEAGSRLIELGLKEWKCQQAAGASRGLKAGIESEVC